MAARHAQAHGDHRAAPRGLSWRQRFETIVATAAVTSLGWAAFGAFWLAGHGGAASAPVDPASPMASEMARTSAAAGDASAITPGSLVIPVAGVAAGQLTDTFTQARAGGLRRHDAIDIMAPRGTPVLAAAAGTVEKLFLSKDGGNTVYVRSPDRRTIYYYAHLDRYADGLQPGQQVKQGQPIAYVGSTGDADPAAPHLHFAIDVTDPAQGWWQGTAINPYPLLGGR